ncbi:hypothetical protein B0H16DRAFT_1815116 [Mycena metata]|uniref:Uncharacterized protein n=1 Tax=Mycena metata TaxID=1033252 RepID=A0AAD7J9H1_9AGAR|nr:hypothetical protein B0H16DRAFT_1815116 [Mycena metata]
MIDTGRQTSAPVPTQPLNAVNTGRVRRIGYGSIELRPTQLGMKYRNYNLEILCSPTPLDSTFYFPAHPTRLGPFITTAHFSPYMPRLSSRQARTRRILHAYLHYHTTRLKKQIKRKNRIKRALRRAGFTTEEQEHACLPDSPQLQEEFMQLSLTPSSSESSSDSSMNDIPDSDDSDSTTSNSWSDILGSDWRGSGDSSQSSDDSTSSSFSDGGDADDEMPELLPLGYLDSDDEDDSELSSTESSTESLSSATGQDPFDWDTLPTDADLNVPRSNNPLRWVRHSLEQMHAQRYEMARDTLHSATG